MLELPHCDSNKYPKHMLLEVLMQYSCIILINCHLLSEGFVTFKLSLSYVGIMMVDCTFVLALQYDMYHDTIFMLKSQLTSFNTLEKKK